MDSVKLKIEKYQKVLSKYFRNLANERNNSLGSSQTYHAIIDVKTNHFQLIDAGWFNKEYQYGVLIHMSIHPETGNIWLLQNNTEIEIDIELEAFGNVPKEHLVLGFLPDYMRKASNYAIA